MSDFESIQYHVVVACFKNRLLRVQKFVTNEKCFVISPYNHPLLNAYYVVIHWAYSVCEESFDRSGVCIASSI
jgi:hypothetical protein